MGRELQTRRRRWSLFSLFTSKWAAADRARRPSIGAVDVQEGATFAAGSSVASTEASAAGSSLRLSRVRCSGSRRNSESRSNGSSTTDKERSSSRFFWGMVAQKWAREHVSAAREQERVEAWHAAQLVAVEHERALTETREASRDKVSELEGQAAQLKQQLEEARLALAVLQREREPDSTHTGGPSLLSRGQSSFF